MTVQIENNKYTRQQWRNIYQEDWWLDENLRKINEGCKITLLIDKTGQGPPQT